MALLEQLRRSGSVVHIPDDAAWAVLGHAEAVEVLTHPETYSSAWGTGVRSKHDGAPSPELLSLNLSDPPLHTALRRAVAQVFTPARLSQLTEGLTQRVREALSSLQERGGDFVTEVAQPVALGTFGEWLSLEGRELQELGHLSRRLARAEDLHPGEHAQAYEEWRSADEAVQAVLREGLRQGRSGIFWELAREVRLNGAPLEERDALYLLRLIVQTGHETTAHALSGALHALLTQAVEFEGLDTLTATEELLRWTTPIIRFGRRVTHPASLGGVALAPGTRVIVFFSAVNRDPAVFPEPDRLVFGRRPNPHLAFGAGPHTCMGAVLARMQLRALVEALREGPRLRLVGEPRRLISAVTSGFASLPVTGRE
ncbi:putative cytochrome P450 hydroxylase [Hyalangium minutum]|uniref:Putative cytochrome P450 hydroxylase n=2 Tax=Hyalangium minutum TaxID=394096 RepID=A0A085WPF6_9BACT|nr:putative cytochrome P450 hydroxylase [Hyalangium minutum]